MILLTNTRIQFNNVRDIHSIPYTSLQTVDLIHIKSANKDDLVFDSNGSIGIILEAFESHCKLMVLSVNNNSFDNLSLIKRI